MKARHCDPDTCSPDLSSYPVPLRTPAPHPFPVPSPSEPTSDPAPPGPFGLLQSPATLASGFRGDELGSPHATHCCCSPNREPTPRTRPTTVSPQDGPAPHTPRGPEPRMSSRSEQASWRPLRQPCPEPLAQLGAAGGAPRSEDWGCLLGSRRPTAGKGISPQNPACHAPPHPASRPEPGAPPAAPPRSQCPCPRHRLSGLARALGDLPHPQTHLHLRSKASPQPADSRGRHHAPTAHRHWTQSPRRYNPGLYEASGSGEPPRRAP